MTWRRKSGAAALAVVAACVGLLARSCARDAAAARASSTEVAEEAISIWASYDGTLDSRQVRNINSDLGGGATVTELAPEGSRVKAGDVLVRFDASNFERDLVKAEHEFANAQAELSQLVNAKQPLELNDIQMNLIQAQDNLEAEEQFLTDTRELAGESLVAEAEVRQEEQKVASLRTQASNLLQKVEMTRNELHPAQLEQANAALLAAERELAYARRQVSNCVIVAPSDGIIICKPVFVGGEQRTIEVGDTVYRNQIFMALPDMSNLIVRLDIPEAELSTIREGQKAFVTPAAYPDLQLPGRVNFVGSMAQAQDGGGKNSPRFFRVVVDLEQTRPELRTGMSVTCRILSFEAAKALLLPRRCVFWENESPYCKVLTRGREEKRGLKLGRADEQRFVVLEGLTAGERVLMP